MTKSNQNSSHLIHEYCGFEGIDRTAHSGGLTDIVNYRIMADKTLRKREAVVQLTTLENRPRAHYVCDSENILILSGSDVIRLNINSLSETVIGSVTSSSGDAQFLCYDGKILLLDGADIYICEDGYISTLEGYAPLYGKGWHPTNKGSIYQEMNLLSRRYRISYDIKEDLPSSFELGVMSESIDAVYLNGSISNNMAFTINNSGTSVSCSLPLKAGDELTFFITAAHHPFQNRLLKSCTRAAVYGEGNGRGADVASIAFCNGSQDARIFCSRKIEKSDFEDALRQYSCESIYVTLSDMLTVGNGLSQITALCRRGGRLLVFTDDRAYVLCESGESSNIIHLSSAGGCQVKDGAVSMGDSPVTVSESGILKWSPVKYDSNEYVAECISIPIGGLPSPSFYTSTTVFSFRQKNEIWFTDPSSDQKRVFIYNHLFKCWYSFIGISADSFFDIGGRAGFFSKNEMYLFNEEMPNDISGIHVLPIVGSITTGKINFGCFDHKKRLHKISMITSPKCIMNVVISDASSDTESFTELESAGEELGYIEKRIPSNRSRYYTVTVSNAYDKNCVLYGMTISAVK